MQLFHFRKLAQYQASYALLSDGWPFGIGWRWLRCGTPKQLCIQQRPELPRLTRPTPCRTPGVGPMRETRQKRVHALWQAKDRLESELQQSQFGCMVAKKLQASRPHFRLFGASAFGVEMSNEATCMEALKWKLKKARESQAIGCASAGQKNRKGCLDATHHAVSQHPCSLTKSLVQVKPGL